MMNQGVNIQTLPSVDPNSVENRYVVDANQSRASSYFTSTDGSGPVSWATRGLNNRPTENGNLSNSNYHHEQHAQPLVQNLQDGHNLTSLSSSSSLVTTNVTQDYNVYSSYPNSSDPYGYASTVYPGYYSGYQQQPNHSYPQPVGAYQNTGAPYQPISSFQNTGSYSGLASYSGTYYNPGDYQTAGGYPSCSYSNPTTSWNEGYYTNYTSHQYSSYTADTACTYSTGTASETSLHYQQQCKQWPDYYGQTEVSCAPGTENLSVASISNQVCPVPGVTSEYPTAHSQPPPPYAPSWRQDSGSSQMSSVQPAATINGSHDSYWNPGTPNFQNHVSPVQPHFQKPLGSKTSYNNFQDQQKVACPQRTNSQDPVAQQMPHSYQSPPVQTPGSLDNRRVSKLQIPTNPQITSNLALVLPKPDKDSCTTTAAAKLAYDNVSLPKPYDKVVSQGASDSILKHEFSKSPHGYIARAVAHCKDDTERATCQTVLKEATADGALCTQDWDTESLFPLPNAEMVAKDNLPSSTPVSSLPKYKRSPNRRMKSRWEPLPEDKSVDKLSSATNENVKFSGWIHANEKDGKHISGDVHKEASLNNIKFLLSQHKSASKIFQRPVKRQRLAADVTTTADNDDASSDSDKEQSLTAYYSGAIALANSPEERMRRENRSKRFEKCQGNGSETNHFKPKSAGAGAGAGTLYARRTTALIISKNFEDGGSRAVEDIDWDALTIKGTCQEIEKRYLRLTSAPDPSTVRPEEVLEKALHMVQSSQKNYLYKCDQLKSIRQDLTVQRIRNQLTVRVYETHARLTIKNGDLPEYNQCQSQLKILYAEGIEGCSMEFSAYNLLCVILHSNNKRELLSLMSRLSDETKRDKAVKHALAVRATVSSGNYVMFFRLYKAAPYLNTCLMDLFVEKMRFKAVSCICRSYRPTVPVSYVAQVLGFTGVSPTNEGCDEDSSGLEECVEWLKTHGAILVTDNNGEVQLDAKASSPTLFMPEPEDAVAHGDVSLAVNDFLARTSSHPS